MNLYSDTEGEYQNDDIVSAKGDDNYLNNKTSRHEHIKKNVYLWVWMYVDIHKGLAEEKTNK